MLAYEKLNSGVKKMKKLFVILSIALLFISSPLFAATHQMVVLSTTDMHGRSTALDAATQGEYSDSMLRVSSAVESVRKEFGDDMIIIDNGDTIQGNLTAQYAINYHPDRVNPMIEELAYIGYDVWGIGNHEFNFLPEMRNQQVMYAEQMGMDVLAANIVLKEDGLNVHSEEVKAGEPFYDPYTVRTIEFEDGLSVKVAIIGLSNAANHTWDLETNYPGLQFSSLENPDGLLEYEINKWVSIVEERENPDIIIVTAHSGAGTDDGVTASFLLEAQALTGARKSSGVDLFIYGHDHTANITSVTDLDGKTLSLVNGGGNNLTKSVFTLEFDESGDLASYSVESSLLPLADYANDERLSRIMTPWYISTYEWASSPLGTFDGGWNAYRSQAEGKTNDDMVLEQNKLMDFIHKAQIWSSWQNYESDGIEGATVSIASAVFGKNEDGTLSFVPSDGDTVSTLELSLLYRYSNNLMCAIEMTGEQLYSWMSTVADMLCVSDGKAAFKEGTSIYGVDTFYGLDYIFDLSKPEGERVVKAEINGTDIRGMDSIRVALNSYRLSGGYGFAEATGLSEADCFWTASTYLGSDMAPVPTQLGEYVKAMGVVTPDDEVSHGYESTWSIIF